MQLYAQLHVLMTQECLGHTTDFLVRLEKLEPTQPTPAGNNPC